MASSFPGFALANPIVLDPLGGRIGAGYLLALPCLALEYIFMWLTLRRDGVGAGSLGRAFLRVHLVSFPATLVLGSFASIFAEALPLLYEPWRYSRIATLASVARVRLRRVVVAANLVSFVAGLVAAQVVESRLRHDMVERLQGRPLRVPRPPRKDAPSERQVAAPERAAARWESPEGGPP